MNKKEFLSCVLSLLVSTGAVAGPRTLTEARELAHNFVSNSSLVSLARTSDLSYVTMDASVAKSPQLYQAYYVFNVGNDGGFVIVSGDDTARPILAYGDKGTFDINDIPSNVKYWLNTYKHQIESIDDYDIETPEINAGALENPGTVVVEPLLRNIEWDQTAPYNLLCPKAGRVTTLTGCAATAMAMVMKYHNYPEKGEGSISYTTNSRKIAVNVNLGSTYSWDKMRDSYNKNDVDEGADAVSVLMYHVGASLYMDYNTSSNGGSGASIFAWIPALRDNFGYNPNMVMMGHDYVSGGEWIETVRAELDAGRPLLYSGVSSGGGHAFVCDGYTDMDFFHFNWGWSGMYNGYYALNALEPGTGGSGAGAGVYNDFQFIVLGVQPEATPSYNPGFYVDGTDGIRFVNETVGRSEMLEASIAELANYTRDFTGKIGLGIFKDNEFVDFVGVPTRKNLSMGRYLKKFTAKGTVPQEIANGHYRVAFCSLADGETVPVMTKARVGVLNYMNMEVSSTQIQITAPISGIDFEQPESIRLEGTAALNSKVKFVIPIRNNGNEYFDSFGVYIKSNTSLSPAARLVRTIRIPEGDSEIVLEGIMPAEINVAGEFQVRATYLDNGKWKLMSKDKGIIINIDETSSIDAVDNGAAISAVVQDGVIRVANAVAGERVELYSVNGKLLGAEMADADGVACFFAAENGLYLVRQGDNTVKVIR